MAKDPTHWREKDTQLSTMSTVPEASRAPVPALTVVAHADRARVGERLILPSLLAGLEIPLSRLEPVFRQPGGGPSRPLMERHLSRKPMVLRLAEGGVVVDASATRTALSVAGRPVEASIHLAWEEVERGVVMTLAQRVALLLHLLPEPVPHEPPAFGLVGDSPIMVRLRQEIKRLAGRDVPVLLGGETGTGKELTARALHDGGARRDGPFVAVNMAALPPSLAVAELFGAVKGSYTGAVQNKTGLFQQARGGTLFLDEIGETPPEVQPMLLRALETGEVRPVGAAKADPVDVRIVAATDADLSTAIEEGSFRAPLYHRLAGYTLRLPPLRERRDDIGRLLTHFLAEEIRLPDDPHWPPIPLLADLVGRPWPGNVRELRNAVRRLAVAGPGADAEQLYAQLEGFPAAPSQPPVVSVPSPAKAESRGSGTRRLRRKASEVDEAELLAALEAADYKIRPAADALGLSRINLYRLIEASPSLRKATELSAEEIQQALRAADGDSRTAARELRVSLQGLKRRMTALGLP